MANSTIHGLLCLMTNTVNGSAHAKGANVISCKSEDAARQTSRTLLDCRASEASEGLGVAHRIIFVALKWPRPFREHRSADYASQICAKEAVRVGSGTLGKFRLVVRIPLSKILIMFIWHAAAAKAYRKSDQLGFSTSGNVPIRLFVVVKHALSFVCTFCRSLLLCTGK